MSMATILGDEVQVSWCEDGSVKVKAEKLRSRHFGGVSSD